jgi:addiction module HigA family antidote
MMDFAAYLDWLVASASAVGSQKKVTRAAPRHPGVILQTEYLTPQGISQSELARRAKTTPAKVNEIVNGKRGVSPAFALALEAVLGTPASLWLSLQAEYDLEQARQRKPRQARGR